MLTIKKKDKVMILSGDDKGKQGEVLNVDSEKGRVIVSKINFVKRHTRPTQTDPGGIHEKEAPLSISKVMLVCPKCSKTTRVGLTRTGEKPTRVCKKCQALIDD